MFFIYRERIGIFPGLSLDKPGWKNLIYRVYSIISTLDVFEKRWRIPKNARLVYVESLNQYDALERIISLLECTVITNNVSIKLRHRDAILLSFNRSIISFIAEFVLLHSSYTSLIGQNSNSRLVGLRFVGLYTKFRNELNECTPKCIIFSNDHNPLARGLCHVSNDLKVDTYYVQHGMVTSAFPKLNFTISFLSGPLVCELYGVKAGNKGIRIVGFTKLDKIPSEAHGHLCSSELRLGIALGKFGYDSIQRLVERIITSNPNIKISLRPHPARANDIYDKSTFCEWSNPQTESSYNWILRNNLIIGGNTSLLAESIYLRTRCYYISWDAEREYYDYYGYLKYNIIERISEEDIVDKVCLEQTTHEFKDLFISRNYGNRVSEEIVKSILDYEAKER